MRVDRHLLPDDEAQWHGYLRDYFCDKDAVVSFSENMIQLELVWPSDTFRHVDPNLHIGLGWWGRGVTNDSMWKASWRNGRILTMLYDTLTLYSWSQWLAKPAAQVDDVVILHVDDHRDLSPPRLIILNDMQIDAITGKLVNMRDPSSILDAISSGAIGMGSFMTPFVRECPQAIVRHLCQPPKLRTDIVGRLTPATYPDTLLYPGAARPAIKIDSDSEGAVERVRYQSTNNPERWSQGLEGRPALVHIDMDYFNNRYDGDSDWEERQERLDPDLPTIFAKIDELVDALASSRAQIEDVTIAYSPGFFPAEYWAASDERLRSGLAKIL